MKKFYILLFLAIMSGIGTTLAAKKSQEKSPERYPIMYAHRGGWVSQLVPENSLAAVAMAARVQGRPLPQFPQQTAIGALGLYISNQSVTQFQPMNINFGIIPALGHKVKGKRNKNAEISARALAVIDALREEVLK